MRRFLSAGLIRIVSASAVLVATVASAQVNSPNTPHNAPRGISCAPGGACQTASASSSFLLPLFLSNHDFHSTAILVNSQSVSTYVDVTVRDSDGNVAVQQRINMAARNHTDIDIGQLLESAHSNATRGSVLIVPATDGTGIGVIGQMSIAYNGSSQPSYLEYEPAKPNPANSLVLRAVADAGQASPIVGITSVASLAQNVTIQCLGSAGPAFSKTVSVPPMGTLLTPACNSAASDPLGSAPSSSADTQTHAEGISLTTDAPPGSFAAVGFAPHHGADGTSFTAVPFSDPKGAKTSTTVFPGLPVGSATQLPGGYYVPELSVANFSSSPAHVTVTYSRTSNGTPEVRTIDTLVVPPGATATADLQGLQGDPGLQNSFEVTSDQPPGTVLDKISSRSDTGIRWVELPGKDLQNSHNAGNHPWTVANGTDSTLLIFNESTAAENFTVRVASGQVVWTKKYSLAPLETKAIDIAELIQDRVKDDSGNTLPLGIQSGQANWSAPRGFGGTGRLLQSNPAQYAALSFSCGEYVVISGGDFYPDVTSELVGQTNYLGTLYAQTSLVEDPVCYGEYIGDSYDYTYAWWSENTSIANISAWGNTSDPEVEGLSPGNAQIDGDVSDDYGCAYLEGVGEAVSSDQTPVITGIDPSVWPAGQTTQVTFTGQNFGTNPPTLTYSDSTITTEGFSSYADTQIVANVYVPAGTPDNEEVQVSVTNNGYGGNSFAPVSGGNPQSGNATATVSSTGPTASLSIKFTGPKSSGDNLTAPSYDCSQNLGLQSCIGWWLYNIEAKGVVSDDASKWTVQQSYTGRAKGYYKDSTGNLQSFDDSLNVPNDGPDSSFLQQPSGQNTIYFIDGPGYGHEYNNGDLIDSITQVQNFTDKYCSTTKSNDCYTITWFLKLVVDPGAKLDTAKTQAGLGSTSTNF
jgi:hypothetical protein